MFRELFILCIVPLFASKSLSISLLFNNLQEFYPGFDANGMRYCKTYYNSSNDCFGGAAKLGSKVSYIRMRLHYSIWGMSEAGVWGIIGKLMMSGIDICRWRLSRIKKKLLWGFKS